MDCANRGVRDSLWFLIIYFLSKPLCKIKIDIPKKFLLDGQEVCILNYSSSLCTILSFYLKSYRLHNNVVSKIVFHGTK